MDTIFMNSENNKTSDPHRLLLNLADKIKVREVANILFYQNLAFNIMEKCKKTHTKIINLKYQLQH